MLNGKYTGTISENTGTGTRVPASNENPVFDDVNKSLHWQLTLSCIPELISNKRKTLEAKKMCLINPRHFGNVVCKSEIIHCQLYIHLMTVHKGNLICFVFFLILNFSLDILLTMFIQNLNVEFYEGQKQSVHFSILIKGSKDSNLHEATANIFSLGSLSQVGHLALEKVESHWALKT